MNCFNQTASLLPMRIYSEMLILPEEIRSCAEEIRLRMGQAIQICSAGKTTELQSAGPVTGELMESVLEKATEASVHTAESCMARGYISIRGGIRLGICGTAVMKSDRVCGMRELSSMALRIPNEVEDCGAEAFSRLYSGGIPNVLIISPPGFGKTTCIRSFICRLSDSGVRVSLADERGEIAAVYNGQAQFDVGKNTDIISSAPKYAAAEMMLKAMNPQLIAMDEISSPQDMAAVDAVYGCGVRLLATAHASGTDELRSRPAYRGLLKKGVFTHAVVITRRGAGREYRVEEIG